MKEEEVEMENQKKKRKGMRKSSRKRRNWGQRTEMKAEEEEAR